MTLSGHADSVEKIIWGGEGLLYSASRDRTIKVGKNFCFFAGDATRTYTSIFRIPGFLPSTIKSVIAAVHFKHCWRC